MPTRTKGTSAERFKEVSLAYEVLKDPERRARYDRYGAEGVFGPGPAEPPVIRSEAAWATCSTPSSTAWAGAAAGAAAAAPGPMPGPDAEMVLRLTFREAVFGVARQVEVEHPGALRHAARARGPNRARRRSAAPSARGRASCGGCASRSSVR